MKKTIIFIMMISLLTISVFGLTETQFINYNLSTIKSGTNITNVNITGTQLQATYMINSISKVTKKINNQTTNTYSLTKSTGYNRITREEYNMCLSVANKPQCDAYYLLNTKIAAEKNFKNQINHWIQIQNVLKNPVNLLEYK